MRNSPVLFAVTLLLSGCAGSIQTTSLRMKGNVPAASVTIDDQYIGALAFVARRGVALPPGTHRITVEKAGYFPWDKLVEAKEGQAPIHLQVELVKIPD